MIDYRALLDTAITEARQGLAEGGIRRIHALQREYLAEAPTPRPIGR